VSDTEREPTEAQQPPDEPDTRELVPAWLAALVLLLLLAVVGVGGFVARGLLIERQTETPEEYDVRRWETAVASDPDDLDAVLSLGFAYQQAGRLEEALAEYERVLAERPQDTAALYNTGMVLLDLADGDAAEEALWDVLEVEPTHVLASKALGELYAERGEYRSLLVAVEPSVEANESSADLQYLMGLAHENLGDDELAIERYRRALTYYPDMPEAKDGLERLGVTP
jgi:tetratricopeptide (TPR) repeat protein